VKIIWKAQTDNTRQSKYNIKTSYIARDVVHHLKPGENMKDKRLERLSDLVRQGVPIGYIETIEVIKYQESKQAHRTAGIMRRFAKWLKRYFARVART